MSGKEYVNENQLAKLLLLLRKQAIVPETEFTPKSPPALAEDFHPKVAVSLGNTWQCLDSIICHHWGESLSYHLMWDCQDTAKHPTMQRMVLPS